MTITIKKAVVFWVGVLIFVSFFCPYYQFGQNKMDIYFSLTCFVSLIVLIIMNYRLSIAKSFLNLLIFMYIVDFAILNFGFLHCHFEGFNRIICFILFSCLTTVGDSFFDNDTIPKLIIRISAVAILFSLFLFFIKIDEISFAGGISYRLQGHFLDRRLTYVFNHKSGYGLILILLFGYVLNNPLLFRSRKSYYLYILLVTVTIAVTGSSTTWVAVIVAAGFKILSEVKQKMSAKKLLIFWGFFVIVPIILFYVFEFMLEDRNLSTGGSRFAIWEIAFDYFKSNSIGLGHNFYSVIFNSGIQAKVNNFHNVFFNEMLHFSVINGLLYFGIIISIVIKCINSKKLNLMASLGVWIPVFMLMLIDNSLIVNNLPVFIVLIYFIFFGKQYSIKKSNAENNHGKK